MGWVGWPAIKMRIYGDSHASNDPQNNAHIYFQSHWNEGRLKPQLFETMKWFPKIDTLPKTNIAPENGLFFFSSYLRWTMFLGMFFLVSKYSTFKWRWWFLSDSHGEKLKGYFYKENPDQGSEQTFRAKKNKSGYVKFKATISLRTYPSTSWTKKRNNRWNSWRTGRFSGRERKKNWSSWSKSKSGKSISVTNDTSDRRKPLKVGVWNFGHVVGWCFLRDHHYSHAFLFVSSKITTLQGMDTYPTEREKKFIFKSTFGRGYVSS